MVGKESIGKSAPNTGSSRTAALPVARRRDFPEYAIIG